MARRPAFDTVVRRAAPLLPMPLVEQWSRLAIGERNAALCLHRVAADRAHADALALPAGELDRLVASAARIGRGRRWLSLTFDDGYLDAVRYVEERAPQHRSVEWWVFACPDKAARRRGFRWDAGLDPFTDLPGDPDALARENDRRALVRAGADARHELADPERLRRLRDGGAAGVGNHTNSHLPLAALADDVARRELECSVRDFEAHLGPCHGFAFPFGTPGRYWRPEHAEQLRAAGVQELWSVHSRTFTDAERTPGAVLPRFPVDGNDDARTILALVAARATLERVRTLGIGRSGRGGRGGRGGPTVVPGGTAPLRTAGPTGTFAYVPNEPLVHLAGPASVDSDAVPLVFVYGASGHAETFRHLAAVLGTARPVYAVRALGLLAGERPAADLDEALEVATDAVKQLGRPVDLVGYSLGGLLAVGMAPALARADLLAAPVCLIDTYDPALEVLPLPVRLRNAAAFARRHGVARVLPWSRRLVERQLRAALHRPRPTAAWLEELGLGAGRVPGLVDLEEHHRAMVGTAADVARVLPSYRGPVRWVRSRDLAPNLPDGAGLGALLGGERNERFVAGDHFSMLSPHRLQRLLVAMLH